MRKIIVQILIVCTSLCAYAQIPTMPRSMLSPNAASLGEYGEVPVSPFTGIPQIEIPIYEIKVGDYSIPISMSYHAGGVRPDQHPGWTGLGWTLNAGGCISRVVNGEADEFKGVVIEGASDKRREGYFYHRDRLNISYWSSFMRVQQLAMVDSMNYDNAPDKFIFNFMGYSGCFYLSEKGGWSVQCDKPIKVEFDGVMKSVLIPTANISRKTYGISFNKFTITTEDGTIYTFGGADNSIEFSIDFFHQKQKDWVGTSWHLTSITYPNNQTINLSYERDGLINQLYKSLYYGNTLMYQDSDPYKPIGGEVIGNRKNSNLNYGQLISPVYLKEITSPYALIKFYREFSNELNYTTNNYNEQYELWKRGQSDVQLSQVFLPFLNKIVMAGEDEYPDCLQRLKWYKLSKISIFERNPENLIRTYNFNYNDLSTQRLMLNSITESNNGTTGRKYQFEYESPGLLPAYLSNEVDHWGFYNNRDFESDKELHYSCREPNATVLKYGTLKKIIYPTGGYTQFEFEPHYYKKYITIDRSLCKDTTGNIMAGGLRIKKIINSDNGGAKEYFYVNDYLIKKNGSGCSSGILGGLSKYYFENYWVLGNSVPNTRLLVKYFTSQSVLPVSNNSQGSHIGYSEVVEKYSDGAFSRYCFSNFDNNTCMDEKADMNIQPNKPTSDYYSSKEQERGLLTLKEDYSSNFKQKRSVKFEYEKDSDSNSAFVKATKTAIIPVKFDEGGLFQYFEGIAYRYYTYSMRKIKETEEIYENGTTPIKSVKTFAYNPNKLVSQITKTIGNNEILRTSYKYPDSYINQNSIYSTMVQRHRLSPIVEVNEERVYDEIFYPLVKTNFNYTTNIMKPSTITQSIKGNSSEVQQTYDYDIMGNPIYEVTSESNHTVYLWGYNYQYLVAIIKNATLNDVKKVIKNIDNFNASATPDFAKLDLLRYYLTEAQITTFQYRPLIGLTSKIDPNGIITYYEYDGLNRLKHIKDNNGCIIESYKYNFNN